MSEQEISRPGVRCVVWTPEGVWVERPDASGASRWSRVSHAPDLQTLRAVCLEHRVHLLTVRERWRSNVRDMF